MRKLSSLSIFFPFWNEEKNIQSVVEKATTIAPTVADRWEVVMVDDGSSDQTLKIAKDLASKNKNLKVITHQPNRGYGAALKEGFIHAHYDYIVFTDGDGQFDFSEVTKFIEKIDSSDMVIGYRKRRHDNPVRHFLMNFLKVWDFIFFGIRFKDIDCGFKMFKKETLLKIMPYTAEGAMYSTELLARAKRAGMRIAEVEVNHFPRKFGDQSGANLRVLLRAIFETLLLWTDLNLRKKGEYKQSL